MMTTTAASTSETYELLVSLLVKRLQTIEILPGDGAIWTHAQNSDDVKSESSYAPFLFVEGNLGIPEKVLYKVYLHAVSIFKSARSRVPTRPTLMVPQDPELDASLVHALAESSSILLLANPSHQTALNARKHLIRLQLIDPHAELRFTASLLSSRHCTKHAELWYHRRWLLSAAYEPRCSGATSVDSCSRLQFTSQEAFQQELELVSRACELYPRNYFAWTHRLICMRSLLSDYLAGMDTIGFVSVFQSEIVGIKGWIDRHVSDYSAIHMTLTLCQAAYRSGELSLMEIVIREDLLGHAISLVQDYPTHETLWVYVQSAICIPNIQQAQQIQQFMDNFVQPLVHLQLQRADTNQDLVKASQHARQFLDRRVGYQFSQT